MAGYFYPEILFPAVIIVSYFVDGGLSGLGESKCLRVPQSKFSQTVGTTISEVRQVVNTISKFSGNVTDFRLNNATADCLYLMDFTVDLLTSVLSVSMNPNGVMK
ncbi:pectinesterase [Striga asiatica]|uniref:Pectinesterase n=1 Tax=Striga asiatica TaxID=4170 RepID=A0A5A7QXY8_STRAF|nr:pectinesterase [Striga asiatica]